LGMAFRCVSHSVLATTNLPQRKAFSCRSHPAIAETFCHIRANCTISGNTGHGIENFGTTTLTNCTLSSNTDAGIDNNYAVAMLTNCTVSGNTGYGIDNYTEGTYDSHTTLLNTIVANNQLHGCWVRVISNGHNLDSDGTCFSSGGTDFVNADPMLAPLANYGGPTQTMALCTASGTPAPSCTSGSPAIDAGDDSVTGPPESLVTDQRGLSRLSGVHVDIGTYEVQQ
jgi:hypothetical protein